MPRGSNPSASTSCECGLWRGPLSAESEPAPTPATSPQAHPSVRGSTRFFLGGQTRHEKDRADFLDAHDLTRDEFPHSSHCWRACRVATVHAVSTVPQLRHARTVQARRAAAVRKKI